VNGKTKLPRDFEVRGEVIMPIASFQRMNADREQQGLSTFANPRNAAAGTIRTLEPNVVAHVDSQKDVRLRHHLTAA